MKTNSKPIKNYSKTHENTIKNIENLLKTYQKTYQQPSAGQPHKISNKIRIN